MGSAGIRQGRTRPDHPREGAARGGGARIVGSLELSAGVSYCRWGVGWLLPQTEAGHSAHLKSCTISCHHPSAAPVLGNTPLGFSGTFPAPGHPRPSSGATPAVPVLVFLLLPRVGVLSVLPQRLQQLMMTGPLTEMLREGFGEGARSAEGSELGLT